MGNIHHLGREYNHQAVEFLEQLRPPPWILIAIMEAHVTGITAHNAEEAETFVRVHEGKRNLYYSVNPTKTDMHTKPKKADIAAIEYLLGDLDPLDDEASEAAKARYLGQLNGTFEPKPSVIVDSGNGIQCLWKLAEPIVLEAANDSIIADVEARSKALMVRLGAKAGTQNVDRILRLPGTTNLPTAKKLKDGRVPCPARLLAFTRQDIRWKCLCLGRPMTADITHGNPMTSRRGKTDPMVRTSWSGSSATAKGASGPAIAVVRSGGWYAKCCDKGSPPARLCPRCLTQTTRSLITSERRAFLANTLSDRLKKPG
jgi:hypothetical protein